MGNLSLLKLSFPSPQVTPMPAAIDLLCSDILPDGLALSPEMAVVANAAYDTPSVPCLSMQFSKNLFGC